MKKIEQLIKEVFGLRDELGSLPRWLVAVFVVLAMIGFADAGYLTLEHFSDKVPLPCSLAGGGCEQVTTSEYSTVFGIPVALGGALYYLYVLALSVLAWWRRRSDWLLWVIPATVVGLLASLWFIYLQLFVINAICVYCMGSATTSTLLFLSAMFVVEKWKKKKS